MTPVHHFLLTGMLVTAGIAASAHAAETQAADPLAEAYRIVPLRVGANPGELIVPVRINGKNARMLVDTGCSMTNLFQGSLKRLGLTSQASETTLRTMGGIEKVEVVTLTDFALGKEADGSLGERKFHVRPGTHPRVDGILGVDVLGLGGELIDMGGARLLIPHKKTPPEALARFLADKKLVAVPLKFHRELPFVATRVDGVEVDLLIDTGGHQPLIDENFAKKAGLTVYPTPARLGGGSKGAGPELGFAAPKKIELTGLTLNDVPCLVADLKHLSGSVFAGMLAGEVLVRLDTVIDIGGRRIFFSENPKELTDTGVIPGALPSARPASALLRDHTLVVAGKLSAQPKITAPEKDEKTGTITLTYRLDDVIRTGNKLAPGDTVTVSVSLPAGEDFGVRANDMIRRHAAAIILKNDENKDDVVPYEQRLLRAGPVRIRQLKEAAAPVANGTEAAKPR